MWLERFFLGWRCGLWLLYKKRSKHFSCHQLPELVPRCKTHVSVLKSPAVQTLNIPAAIITATSLLFCSAQLPNHYPDLKLQQTMDGHRGRITAALHQTLLSVRSVVEVQLSYEETRGLVVVIYGAGQRIAAVYITALLRLMFNSNAAE